jgi:hypothetical protein
VFNIAAPFQYKVEFGPAPAGPWTPILTPIHDFVFNPDWVGFGGSEPNIFDEYDRLPIAGGWYAVSEIGLAGFDYLTDWHTPAGANDLHYLKLTVRNAMLSESESPVVPARVDNSFPTTPDITLELQTPDGAKEKLGCCAEVKQGNGNLIVITLQASDPNFSAISVSLIGGCGVSIPIVATDGTALSKTYNGDVTDTGYPAATAFTWDPWAAGVDPCCYLVYVTINDRAILNDAWSGGHVVSNWQSLTIA